MSGQFFTGPEAQQLRGRGYQYEGCAGNTSEGNFFATNPDPTRKLFPTEAGRMTRGRHPLVPDQFESAGVLKTDLSRYDDAKMEASFQGSAGSQSTKLHKEIRGKLVPQLRDTADDIILNRDMDHPSQIVNEQAFIRMQEGAAGIASREANENFFDARLNKDSSRTGVPPELFSEPPGRLRGTIVYAPEEAVNGLNTAARHAASLEGAMGVTRQQFRGGAEHYAYDGSLRGGTEHGKASSYLARPRHDLRSTDMAAALNPAIRHSLATADAPHASATLAAMGPDRPERLGPTAGKSSRMNNDKKDMFLAADVDTDIEQAAYAKVMGGAAMTELLAGDGYYQRTDPRQLARLDGNAPKRGIYDQAPGADGGPAAQLSQSQKNSQLANRDTVGADNLLQPDSEGGASTQGGTRAMGAVRQDNLQRRIGPPPRPPPGPRDGPLERYSHPYNNGASTCTRPELYTHNAPFAMDEVPRFTTFAREEAATALAAREASRIKMEATGGVQGSTFHHPWHEQPEELVAMTEGAFIAARNRHEVEGTGDQIDKNGHSVRGIGGAPFGTRPEQRTSYQTASQAAWSCDAVGANHASMAPPTSMAGRIAQRRLQSPRGQSRPSQSSGHGGSAIMPVGQRR